MTAGCKATHKCNDFAFLSTIFSEYDFFMQTILICPEIPISHKVKSHDKNIFQSRKQTLNLC